MTQVSDILPSTLGGIKALAIKKNAEIAVRCPEHGEFSHGELLEYQQYALHEGECPKCRIARNEALQRQVHMERAAFHFRELSGVPPRFQGASFDNYQPGSGKAQKILATMREYAEKFEQHRKLGLSLILCGGPGTGKTHLSCAVLRALALEHGITGRYCTAYRAILYVRESYRSRDTSELQEFNAFINPDMLVLDEIGVQYGTDSEHLILFSILNGRYEAMKPTIVVSNLNVDGVKKYLDERVYDRLRENGGGILAFDWESWRAKRSR